MLKRLMLSLGEFGVKVKTVYGLIDSSRLISESMNLRVHRCILPLFAPAREVQLQFQSDPRYNARQIIFVGSNVLVCLPFVQYRGVPYSNK